MTREPATQDELDCAAWEVADACVAVDEAAQTERRLSRAKYRVGGASEWRAARQRLLEAEDRLRTAILEWSAIRPPLKDVPVRP